VTVDIDVTEHTDVTAPIGLSAADAAECHIELSPTNVYPCDVAFYQNSLTICSVISS